MWLEAEFRMNKCEKDTFAIQLTTPLDLCFKHIDLGKINR